MERKELLPEFTVVASLSAAVVFATLHWMDASIALARGPKFLVELLAATGTYLLVFKAVIWLYYNGVWRVVNGKRYVGGVWNYRYNQTYDAAAKRWDPAGDKSGVVRIDHSVEGVFFHGESSSPDAQQGTTSLASQWHSESCSMHDERLYVAISIETGAGSEHGFALINIVTQRPKAYIVPVPPKSMRGHYFIFTAGTGAARVGRIEFERGQP